MQMDCPAYMIVTVKVEDVIKLLHVETRLLVAEDVPNIRAAMLIHHGALDTRLVNAYPAYEAAMQSNNVTHEGHIYPDSVHGFFNDATPERYNKAAAEEAWTHTINWFNRHVREGAA